MFSLDDLEGNLHHFEEKPSTVTAKRIATVELVEQLNGDRRKLITFEGGVTKYDITDVTKPYANPVKVGDYVVFNIDSGTYSIQNADDFERKYREVKFDG